MKTPSIRHILQQNARAEEMLREDAIDKMFSSGKAGCPRSYSNEHSFETYGMPKGKMKCVHCGKIKTMRKAN